MRLCWPAPRSHALLALAAGLVMLAGCATQKPEQPAASAPALAAAPAALPARAAAAPFAQATGEVLGRNQRLLVYSPRAGDSLGGVAARFLGSGALAWAIADTNGLPSSRALPAPDVPLIVPLRSFNPVGVEPEHYQTVPILCYHRFGAPATKMMITPAGFAAQLEWLAKNDYRVITLADLRPFLEGRKTLPQRAVVITIDDGYESVYRHAFPLLKKYGFAATVFAYTDFIGVGGDSLSWAQLQEMQSSGLVDVQSHSKSHRNLVERSAAETDARYRSNIEQEIRLPRELMNKRLVGANVRHIAYPFGDANQVVLDNAMQQGFELGATVASGGNAFFAQPLLLRRTMIFGDLDLEGFKSKLQTSRPFSDAPSAQLSKTPNAPFDGPEDVVQLYSQRAAQAEAQGRWAQAALAWEALSVVAPTQSSALQNLLRTRRTIDTRVAEALSRAGEDRRKGDTERATRGYLLALALAPDNLAAMDALRAIERERAARSQPTRFARNALDGLAGAARTPSNPLSAPAESNLLEHASLMASQGEIDSAITLLRAPAQEPRADPALRRMLAELHYRRAEALLPEQPKLAVAALNECLRLDPTHSAARARLKSLGG